MLPVFFSVGHFTRDCNVAQQPIHNLCQFCYLPLKHSANFHGSDKIGPECKNSVLKNAVLALKYKESTGIDNYHISMEWIDEMFAIDERSGLICLIAKYFIDKFDL